MLPLLGYSCVNKKTPPTVEQQPTGQPFSLINQGWKDTLEASKAEMKKIWLNSCNPKSEMERAPISLEGYNVLNANENVDQLELIPVEVYVIKWDAFMNWTPSEPVKPLLTLDRSRARYSAVLNEKFIFKVNMNYENSKWEYFDYSPIFSDYADTLTVLYFKKGVEIVIVNVESSAEEQPYERIYYVYEEDNILKVLKFGGISKPFKQELAEFKEVLKSGQMW
jgi:hypothetical protein